MKMHGSMKLQNGDFAATVVVSVIFLFLTFVTAVFIQADALAIPLINSTLQHYGANSTYQHIPAQLASNLNSFNYYLPLILFAVLLGSILSTILLSVDPLAILASIIFIPFTFFIAIYISNFAHGILGNAAIAQGVAKLSLPILIMADLPTIMIAFAFLYIITLAIRIFFFDISGRSRGGGNNQSGGLYGGQ